MGKILAPMVDIVLVCELYMIKVLFFQGSEGCGDLKIFLISDVSQYRSNEEEGGYKVFYFSQIKGPHYKIMDFSYFLAHFYFDGSPNPVPLYY